MNKSINDKAVCRTVQATPCLFNIPTKKQQYEILIFGYGRGKKIQNTKLNNNNCL